ncbi:MAG: glycosyltransferase family 39 protein [Chloroflexi bacterium]|nr:glycosyltransferase family 39 protein [Chloroflexota bacterium]
MSTTPATYHLNPNQQHKSGPRSPEMLFLLLGLLLAFALRIYDLTAESIWYDEAASILIARRPFSEIAFLPAIHPPLYFYLLHFWMGIAGDSEFAVRMLSVLTSLLLVAMLYRIGTSLFSAKVGGWSMALGIISPFLVFHAQETRMYTLLMLLTVSAGYLLWKSVNSPRLATWTLLALTLTLGLYTHYSFFLFLLAANLWIILRAGHNPVLGQGRTWLSWLTVQGVALEVFILYLPIFISQLRIPRDPIPQGSTLSGLTGTLGGLLLGPALPEVASLVILLLTTGLFAGFFIPYRQSLLGEKGQVLTLFLLWLIVPLASLLAVINLQTNWRPDPRYVALVAPTLLILLAWLIAHWEKISPPAGFIAGLGGILILSAGTIAYFWPESMVRDDARGLSQYLSARVTDQDLVLTLDNPFPFEYYYRGEAPLSLIKVRPESVAADLGQLSAGRERAYLIRWFKTVSDPWDLASFLLERESHDFTYQDFHGYRSSEFHLRDNPSFALEAEPRIVKFGEAMDLQGISWGVGLSGGPNSVDQEIQAGNPLSLLLQWRLLRSGASDYAARLQLLDGMGKVVAESAVLLRNQAGLYSSRWAAPDSGWSMHRLLVPAGSPAGNYYLEVSLYDHATGVIFGEAAPIVTLRVRGSSLSKITGPTTAPGDKLGYRGVKFLRPASSFSDLRMNRVGLSR